MLPSSWINDALVRVRREKDEAEAADTPDNAAPPGRVARAHADSGLKGRLTLVRREENTEAEPEIPEERWTGRRSAGALVVAEGPRFAS